MPIVSKDADRAAVAAAADALVAAAAAAGIRVRLDADTERTPGWKYNHWETKARLIPYPLGCSASLTGRHGRAHVYW